MAEYPLRPESPLDLFRDPGTGMLWARITEEFTCRVPPRQGEVYCLSHAIRLHVKSWRDTAGNTWWAVDADGICPDLWRGPRVDCHNELHRITEALREGPPRPPESP